MFRIDQIINSSRFVRHFRELSAYLAESNEPLLVTQKNGKFLVVMDGDFFQGLIGAHAEVVASSQVSGAESK
jgi:hypothetical protein